MLAVDTNVVARFLTEDHKEQAAIATALFTREPVWIAKTVLLETAWVLGDAYGFQQPAILDALTKVIGLQNVQIEDEPAVSAALALTAHGVSFADALHLTSRPAACGFVSFDRNLVRRANRAGVVDVFDVSAKR
ncbi:MAG TPA: type II toxin-antitoxin system VapC family toxin [Bryobacteraceae bacterium]|nr:type II toxin-antitoxin system VapC family toxin [Bryobacteraceae bacterium]